MKNTNLAETQNAFSNSTVVETYQIMNPGYELDTEARETSDNFLAAQFQDATDEVLVQIHVKYGAEWPFNELVNRYGCKIYKLAHKYTRDDRNADDVLQEVFLTLFQKLSTFRGESKFSTWLYGLTRNTSLMYLKKHKKHLRNLPLPGESDSEEGAVSELAIEDWRFIPDNVLMEEQRRAKVEDAMSGIPEIYSSVLRLRDLEERTNEEVGELLGISLSAVKSRVRRARMYVKENLAGYSGAELY